MLRRHEADLKLARIQVLPPFEFANVAESFLFQVSQVAASREYERIGCLLQPAQRGKIHVVVMVVTDQHNVDLRQVFETNTRIAMAARTYPGKGTASIGPDGIRQDVAGIRLNQDGCMIDECVSNPPGTHALRRPLTVDRWYPPGPRLSPVLKEESHKSERIPFTCHDVKNKQRRLPAQSYRCRKDRRMALIWSGVIGCRV